MYLEASLIVLMVSRLVYCFVSIDPSRRGDLEIMGYCLLQWAAGRLPWEDKLENKDYVGKEKIRSV